MAAILKMPQYVAYQKNVVYAFIKLGAKSHSFNILRTMDDLSCPTISNYTEHEEPHYTKYSITLSYFFTINGSTYIYWMPSHSYKSGILTFQSYDYFGFIDFLNHVILMYH